MVTMVTVTERNIHSKTCGNFFPTGHQGMSILTILHYSKNSRVRTYSLFSLTDQVLVFWGIVTGNLQEEKLGFDP